MTKYLFIKLILCVSVVGFSLIVYIDHLNKVTKLRLVIPDLAKEIKDLQEENHRLRYEIDIFESPLHLMELTRQAEFSHLKYPYNNQIHNLPLGKPVQMEE